VAQSRPLPHYTRNLIALTTGTVTFLIGLSFTDASTVLPSFAAHLTSSALLIGLLSTIGSGGWLLPQLIAANYVADKPAKKPYMILPALIGRPLYLVLALITYFFAADQPLLTLVALYVVQAVFWVADGLATPPWFDVLEKAIPGRRRNRYVGVSQVLGGVLAVGAGIIVRRVLDPAQGLPFPTNYAALFATSFVFYALSTLAQFAVVEPIEASAVTQRPTWRQYLPLLATTLREDRPFRQAIAGRLLAGFGGMALPFYILFGTDVLGLSAAAVGTSVTAQMLGRVLGGVLLSAGSGKLGNRFTLLTGLGLTSLAPLLALAVGLLRDALEASAFAYALPLIFFFIGISMNAVPWGFTNYVLDIAPPQSRPMYVGLTNTILGLLIIAPIVGGAILQATSYVVLFAVSLGIFLASIWLTWRQPVPPPRE